MKRYLILMISVALCVMGTHALAGGAADKVTGEYAQGSCNGCQPGDVLGSVAYRLVSAHEAFAKRPQKGFFLSWTDSGLWFEVDFNDTVNTCVNVYQDGHARIGGLVSDGNGAQVGRYFGFYVVDEGEPAYFADHGFTYRVSLDYYSEDARLAFLDWCSTGNLAGLEGEAVWPSIVFQGNLQVFNSSKDGD